MEPKIILLISLCISSHSAAPVSEKELELDLTPPKIQAVSPWSSSFQLPSQNEDQDSFEANSNTGLPAYKNTKNENENNDEVELTTMPESVESSYDEDKNKVPLMVIYTQVLDVYSKNPSLDGEGRRDTFINRQLIPPSELN